MKKVLCLASLVALIALDSYAKDYREDIHGGIAHANFMQDNRTAFTAGYGITKSLDNKMLLGVSFDADFVDLADGSLIGAGTDFKVGYNVWERLNAYGILGAKLQSVDGDAAYGLGFGVGVDYPINKDLSAAIEYKDYTMNASNISDYDYKTLGLVLKYAF